MRVLVTGAGGFIGSHVVKRLLATGCSVAGMSRSRGVPARLEDVADRVTLVRADMGDAAAVGEWLRAWRPDCCIHLAWYTNSTDYLTSPKNIEALVASLTLLRELARAECPHVIVAGTCAEYALGPRVLSEEADCSPATLYAAAKLALHTVGAQIATAASVTFTWARIFSVYGPTQGEGRLVPDLIRTLHAGDVFRTTPGRHLRDYLHVEDVSSALCRLVQSGAPGTFNISSGEPVTQEALVRTAAELIGRPDLVHFRAAEQRPWEPEYLCGDSTRLRRLGWSPCFLLEEGLAHTIHWWKDDYETSNRYAHSNTRAGG